MTDSRTRHRLAVFTICSNNYLAFARVLFDSVRQHHPEAELFLCLADRKADLPGLYDDDDLTIVEAHTLPIPAFPRFAFRYNIMEFNTALKPFMVSYLMERLGFDVALYFDPDIELFRPLSEVVDTLASGASFALTPHLCSPSPEVPEPNDLTILRAGTYNLGFLGVSNTAESININHWWARRLLYQCVNAQADGLFVDQKFMDLVPGFARKLAICRDTTLNVAYWNLAQRRLNLVGSEWFADDAPLTFFHFSGFDPNKPTRLSRHDPRFVDNLSSALGTLTQSYAAKLFSHQHENLSSHPYAYGTFDSGEVISSEMRSKFRMDEDIADDPFSATGTRILG